VVAVGVVAWGKVAARGKGRAAARVGTSRGDLSALAEEVKIKGV
jgi:hypothetical protein